MLGSVGSSLKSPMAMIRVAGSAFSTESAIRRICSPTAMRLNSEASLPPSREGQCATMKKKGSSSILPHIVRMSRVLKLGSDGTTVFTG